MKIWPKSIFSSVGFPISIARSQHDLTKVGHLRYELYVDRDKKAYAFADHRGRALIEPVDAASLNFYSSDASGVCSAVRLTGAEDASEDPLLAALLESARIRHMTRVVTCSRFAVQPTLAARKTIMPLFREVCRAGLKAGAVKCLLATRPSLVGIFAKFGFRSANRTFVDRVAGELSVCEFDLHDLQHLVSISSPVVDVIFDHFSTARKQHARSTANAMFTHVTENDDAAAPGVLDTSDRHLQRT